MKSPVMSIGQSSLFAAEKFTRAVMSSPKSVISLYFFEEPTTLTAVPLPALEMFSRRSRKSAR